MDGECAADPFGSNLHGLQTKVFGLVPIRRLQPNAVIRYGDIHGAGSLFQVDFGTVRPAVFGDVGDGFLMM